MNNNLRENNWDCFKISPTKIIKVVPNDDYTLILFFENGEVRLYDLSSSIMKEGSLFERFLDLNKFRQVYLDEVGAVSWDIDPNVDSRIVWENKIDLCPDSCYWDSVPLTKEDL